jgi:diguanylate cyclase (GGDEF)-like protein
VLIFAAVLLLELRSLSKDRLDAEKETSKTFQNMANTDSLTGVRNRHAYSEYEGVLNRKIQNKEIQELAVVVCDINGLKYINDTQGHAAGDQLIKEACALICEYFKHGAVFRVGGDEFVVILQEKGYETMDEEIGKLNKKVEANIKNNGIVVSIGSSVLQPDDSQLHDVFARADHMMYERKSKLKSMGAKARD